MRVILYFTSSYEGVYLKEESSNKNRTMIQMPKGQVKPNVTGPSTENLRAAGCEVRCYCG